MSSSHIPDDFTLDVHDLAAIILYEHSRSETLLPNSQLVEINRGVTSPVTLPAHVFAVDWHVAQAVGQKRVAYILKKNSDAAERVTVDTFASPDGVKIPGGDELTRRELEDVFWRCKTFNSGYVLGYVAQRVFDSLPHTARLRARTSAKHEVICRPSEVAVGEIDILAKEAYLIVDYEPRPDLGEGQLGMAQHLSGFGDESMPWVFLLLGEAESKDLQVDHRVVLDLVVSQIGGRGGGGEVFALERAFDYHSKVLPKVANELEKYVLSHKLIISEDSIRTRAEQLVAAVMGRVRRIACGDDDFCRYCGKDEVTAQCSKCKKARFCSSCHVLGWKYHKSWCT